MTSASSLSDDDEIAAAASGEAPAPLPANISDDPELQAAHAGKAADSAKPPKRVGWMEENLLGPTEVLGSSVANIPHAAAHAGVDLWRRLSGGDTSAPDPSAVEAIHVPTGQGGTQLLGDISKLANIGGGDSPQDAALHAQHAGTRPNPLSDSTRATVADVLHQTGQVAGDVGALAPVVGAAGKGINMLKAVAPEAGPTAQAAADAAVASRSQGSAAVPVDTSTLAPQTQAAIAKAHSAGLQIDDDALRRVAKAESVGVHLTEGEAQQDTGVMSNEFNNKGEDNSAIGARHIQTDDALRDKVANLHQEDAPTAVANDEIKNGSATLDGLKRYDAPKKAEITAAYDDAEADNAAAGKGVLKLDAQPAVDHITEALTDKEDLLPSEGKGIVEKLKAAAASGTGIPIKQMETYKTIVSRASRQYEIAGNTNAVNALSDLRDGLEKAEPAAGSTATTVAKFNKARGLARNRFDEMDADPAYKAAVNDETPIGEQSPLADKFTQKYIQNAPRANLQKLRGKLSGDQEANEAMDSSTYNSLRTAGETGKGWSAAQFKSALKNVQSKPELLSNPASRETLDDVNQVGQWVQNQRRGGTYNNSHTSHALQKAASIAGSAPARLIAGAIPYGTEGVNLLQTAAEHNGAFNSARSLAPGAGLVKAASR